MDESYQKVTEGLIRRIRRYNQSMDAALLRKAFEFSFEAHRNQLRKSGHIYFEHPLEVAKILVGLKMDYETVAAAILHDVAEDTEYTIARVESEFGPNIAGLVDGVTKISDIKLLEFEERQAENFRKMLLSMVKDIRVIIIKFADRLHNMRTLEYLPEKKRRRIALETREVYAPLAHRLGLAKIKWELEDLSLKFLEPEIYADLVKRINASRDEREELIRHVTRPVREALVESKIHARFEGRPKHFYSIYNKIVKRGILFEEIYDLHAIRIIVEKVEECYHTLGIVHSLYTPIHERFKDYISAPKSNGYQSLHTTVIGPDGKKVEIQIRTEEMHRTAEDGIAAHWRYKEGRLQEDELDKHMGWMRQVLEAVDDEEVESSSFMEHLKINLFQDEVFVFTPRGDLYRLPAHSTPVDFAFAVHTDIGLHCLAAKVNGRIVPLSHQLRSGDTVEIITSANQRPNEGWLNFAISSKAKGRIKKWLRDTQFERSTALGEEILTRSLSKFSIKLKEVNLSDLAAKLSLKDAKQLLAGLGRGEIKLEAVLHKILPEDKPVEQESSLFKKFIERARKSSKGVSVAGMDNIMLSFGKCCNPVPGDPITGIVTRGRGIVVHANTCNNLLRLMQETERIIDVAWDVDKGNRFLAGLYILCERRSKFLAELSDAVSNSDGIIASANMSSDASLVNCMISVEVYDLEHLNRIIAKIKKVAGVISVSRWSEPK
ncbi:MAG TPA: bifunctional (p)ppGpp synthetase/guanosine-3',5'-bis(diphosphate) 3'-pyrophosphohydrolase [bacterium]|nr:bifunctional (p)ppGpp synthetase/guanosine-3',5'-bis(diphosphate) 3'-pyrophosphohydrolase [bacterium]HQI48641.1 bifunctional (p)ppGpp synthetase/guanosine-3',5'-bis(diphosphate) 3'-pyrophosphohydrolase [bacterium]HQJ66111.1 bifunctional (p)ppGpp synthetase/guanosine-3',5'-bis(diphosphate) 3'-pyrophosphohydrolase [bacterium]